MDLWCSARVLRLGNRVAVADCEIWQGDPENPIGKARAVYNVVQSA
jgi:acyl-coenzyme A thioesterase PaaI-like protein